MRHQGQQNSFANQVPTIHIENIGTPSSSPVPDNSPPPSISSTSSQHLCSTFLQMCCGLVMGSLAACSMALSLATDSWLFTREPYRFSQEELDAWNITDRRLLPRVEVNVRSGLWRVCTTGIAGSAGAIRYSTPAFVTALLAVTIATVLLFVGVVQRTVKTLLASFLYVTTGLCLAVAIIIYISAINDEVGYSTRKSSNIDFHYNYGWSFFAVCLSFLASEGAAVLSTMQYLRTKGSRSKIKADIDDSNDMLPTAPLSQDALRIWSSFESDNSVYGNS